MTIDAKGGVYTGETSIKGTYETTAEITNPTAGPNGHKVTLEPNYPEGKAQTKTQTTTFSEWELTGKGSYNAENKKYTFGAGNATLTAKYTTDTVDLGIPEREGYEFEGWYTEEEEGDKIENPTEYEPEEDTTLYAYWTLKQYTITYENTKNSDNSKNPTTYTIEDEDIVLEDLTDQGKYRFKGWYTTNDKKGKKVTSIETSEMKDITLYAQWESEKLYLSSEKYKVGERDIDNYEEGDVYLDKIEPYTTLVEFMKNCETNGEITVINENEETLEDDDLVGTNMTIKITRYDEEITITAVVMGDIDGDGETTAQDLSELNKAYLGISERELTGARFKAADIDDSGRITATDLSELNRASLGISKLTYKKPRN